MSRINKYQSGGFNIGGILQNILNGGSNNFLNDNDIISNGALSSLFGDVFNGQLQNNNATPTNIQLVNGFHGFQEGGIVDNQGKVGGDYLNLSPMAVALSKLSDSHPADLAQLALETRRHESGRNFGTDQESKTKQFSGGPGRGAYQIEGKSLPTLAKKARALYRMSNILPPKELKRLEEGKIKDATKLDPQLQEDLFFAGFTQFRDGELKATRSLEKQNLIH